MNHYAAQYIAKLAHFVLFSFLLGVSSSALAAIETYQFNDYQQEKDYNILIDELRCLVCQNQNLADSNAKLAKDLRQQVYTMLTEEKSTRDDVVDFMINRYGDFVLYKPPVKTHTYLLWFGPLLFLLLGGWIVFRQFSSKEANARQD